MINYKAICDNTQGHIMFRDCNASAESATGHGREHEVAIRSMIQIRKRIYFRSRSNQNRFASHRNTRVAEHYRFRQYKLTTIKKIIEISPQFNHWRMRVHFPHLEYRDINLLIRVKVWT